MVALNNQSSTLLTEGTYIEYNQSNSLKFTHKARYGTTPQTLKAQFKEFDHQYLAISSENSFYCKKQYSKSTSFPIPFRGPYVWNKFLYEDEKKISF